MTTPCSREDREGRCDADDGFPCADCERRASVEAAYWYAQFKLATLEERDPARYIAELIDAGRIHLVKR